VSGRISHPGGPGREQQDEAAALRGRPSGFAMASPVTSAHLAMMPGSCRHDAPDSQMGWSVTVHASSPEPHEAATEPERNL